MEFHSFLKSVQDFAVIDMRFFPPAQRNSHSLKVQVSRWVGSGKLIQLRRGFYLLSDPYRKIQPLEFYISSVLKNPSYISLNKALEYHGLIPEAVSVYTAVTTKRAETLVTPAGQYDYRHVQPSLFWGYNAQTIDGQTFFMADPEKALLDFFYFNHVPISADYLYEMRLQNLGNIKPRQLLLYARRFKRKNLERAAKLIIGYIQKENTGVKKL